MSTQYVGKTQAVTEIMQRAGVGRFVAERKINELEEAGQIRIIDDPRDIRRKLISQAHIEAVIQALTPV